MKKSILIVAFLATAFVQNSFAQLVPTHREDSTKQSQLPQLLSAYYNIKDALVAGNASDAVLAATSFVKAANSIDRKVISEENITALLKDAGKISGTKDIKKQREYFASLSSKMAAVAKAVKLSDQPVYQAYCPMKKAYWLSSEKAINNPYYGSVMLTCGAITDTF